MVSSLYVEVPNEPPFEVRLDKDVVSVGRSEDNVLGLRDMNVSRHHFAIERQPNGWLLRDRGSRNGTLVNRKVVLDKILIDGDRIEVGGSALTFRAQASRNSISTDAAPKPKPGPLAAAAPPPPTPAASPLPAQLAASLPAMTPVPDRNLNAAALAAQLAVTRERPSEKTPMEKTNIERPALARTQLDRPAANPSDMGAISPVTQERRLPTSSPLSTPALTPPSGLPPAQRQPPVAVTAPLGAPVEGASRPRTTDRWRKLAELTGAINQEHDLQRLLDAIVDAVLSLVPARGAFLVTVGATGELELRVERNIKVEGEEEPGSRTHLSWNVCKQAIAEKKPILTRDAFADHALSSFSTVASLRLRGLLCVPFGRGEEVVGTVYLDEPSLASEETDGDVIDLVRAFGDLAGIAFQNARHLEEVKERERLAEGLRLASKIQKRLLPEKAPELLGLEVAGKTIPAEEIGGDLYDFFGEPPGDDYISIGDVSGKGVGAGIVMASVHALLRAYAESERRTDRILVSLNKALARDLEKGSFVSLLLLRWSRQHRALAYSAAGHEHMLILRAKTGALETIRSGGVVLGLHPNLEGKVEEKVLDLAPGDCVVLYTDGATEAASPTGEEFGLARVEAAVRETRGMHPSQVVDHVVGRVQEFQGAGRAPRDDLTVVAMRKTP